MNFNFIICEALMSFRNLLASAVLLFALTAPAFPGPPEPGGGESPQPMVASRSLEDLNSSPIQDNSFLVEEAYNQEDGVVQHISLFQKLSTGDWAFTQTDEWPLRSLKNQLSITVAATHSADCPASGGGWGDTAMNYRYQLIGSGDTKYAVAPRLSLLLPTGNPAADRGYGGVGL